MNVSEHLYYYVIHSCVYTHIEVLALGTVVLVIKVTKFTLNVVEQDSICRGGIRLFRASWDRMVNRLIM